MSRKRWKHRRRGCGWSYSEWSHDDGDDAQRQAGWTGGGFGGPFGGFGGPFGGFGGPGAAWSGPGFFGGRNFRILSGLRRDPWHGKVAGVAAGIGGYYGIRPKWIRIALLISLFINPPLTILGYLIATVLLKPLPMPNFGGQSETNAGTSAQEPRAEAKAEEELPPELRFAALKDKFRELEGRTGDIEGLVTSPEFRLRRDFRKMREGDEKPEQ
jgi:phage shock protein PspC (stress-responsive transcriptional regulator)